ncbi:hypothetical protein Q5530_05570 [Saccharothrix sp. BKS2]|uniref:hypothetical protein n=1 Tax=Saccharothrix sp. BKS2 TaxID=3064400 RepID=UPI0039EBF197
MTGPAGPDGPSVWAVDVAELARWAPAVDPDAAGRRALSEALEELEEVRGDAG